MVLISTNHNKLLPETPQGKLFIKYFNHPWNFIFKVVSEDSETNWITETRYPLQPRNLWSQYLSDKIIVGLRFGSNTRYAMIDIDTDSPYHPFSDPDAIANIQASLKEIGLNEGFLVQSSESKGIHLYYCFPEPVPTFGIACAITQCLKESGFIIAKGKLEVFPNCKRYEAQRVTNYNGHRLPLQKGSYLLDRQFFIKSNDIDDLLYAMESSAEENTIKQINQAIVDARHKHRNVKDDHLKWKLDLEERIETGWTGDGQTNELLKDIACYGIVWQGLKEDALTDFIEQTAISCPGFEEFCDHKTEIRQRSAEWATVIDGFYTPYRSWPKRDKGFSELEEKLETQPNDRGEFLKTNAERHAETYHRVEEVVRRLRAAAALPETVTARLEAISNLYLELFNCGISRATLYKVSYLGIWHPDYTPFERCVTPLPEGVTGKLHTPPMQVYEGLVDSVRSQPQQAATTDIKVGGTGGKNASPPPAVKSAPENTADSCPGDNLPILALGGSGKINPNRPLTEAEYEKQRNYYAQRYAINEAPRLETALQIKRTLWRNTHPGNPIRRQIREWAANTPGIVLTDDGPALDPNYQYPETS
ncbi:hypothetical protein NIES2119_08055 [[Phormidium ambiguum] IAM M-71]|uniref:Uncharacterized protein n=1 Tax=[Phormidium ambiguum] IAM M-71 TaxID=454136 RepID=A0A1U7IP66_9CYAN|nr:hypothetical protein [Phormidium ambiguum]OKH39073.1 hypothetical protein NIES2119_08055 [Phormidium ambiguum IAM M-71]